MVAVADPPKAAYELQPKQLEAMRLIWEEGVEQILYGGAGGGGKSHWLRALAYTVAMMYPGARIAIFRENYTQLQKTQLPFWKREMRALGYDVDSPKVWHASDREFTFPNGSVVEFLHLDQSEGAEKWLSAEWAMIGVDEATRMSDTDLRTLYSRVRATEEDQKRWAEQPGVPPWRPIGAYCSNPGGKSHPYFKREFVEPGREHGLAPWDYTQTIDVNSVEMDVIIRRAFLPAFLIDNPALPYKQYVATLAQLPESRRNQILSGDWDYFEGQVFGMLVPDIHLVDRAWLSHNGRAEGMPPPEWPRMAGQDHGNANPEAVERIVRDEDGNFIFYMEYYDAGTNGHHIEEIKQQNLIDTPLIIIGDPQMWREDVSGKVSVYSEAHEYEFNGEPPETVDGRREAAVNGIKLTKRLVTRSAGRQALERLFEPDENRLFPGWHPKGGLPGSPRAFICRQCPNLWREINEIQWIEGVEDTVKAEDHAYDAAWRVTPIFEQGLLQLTMGRYHRTEIEAAT